MHVYLHIKGLGNKGYEGGTKCYVVYTLAFEMYSFVHVFDLRSCARIRQWCESYMSYRETRLMSTVLTDGTHPPC